MAGPNSTQENQVISILSLFGCNQRESKIYIKVLELGPSTIQDISRALKQNRITIHSAVQQLIEKGLLYESRKGNRRLIVAEEPIALHNILERKESELRLVRSNVDALVRYLSFIPRTQSTAPIVKFYEGKDGFKKMLNETLGAKGEVLVITYVDLFARAISQSYLEEYFKARAKRGIHSRLIYPPSRFGARVHKRSKEYRIQIRVLPPELEWSAGVFSWNDSIGIQSLTEGRLTCTIIENRDIANFWRTIIFPIVWRFARPLSLSS